MPNINVTNFTVGAVLYSIWASWILTCTLGSLWTLDLINYANEDCLEPIDLGRSIPILLMAFADFNGLILLLSLFVIFIQTQKEILYKSLAFSAIVASLIQFGLNITLFLYVSDIRSMTLYSDTANCEFGQYITDIAYYSYYCLFAALAIVLILTILACIIGVIMLFYPDQTLVMANYILEGDIDDNEVTTLIQTGKNQAIMEYTDFDEKETEYKQRPFRGKLNWNDYREIYLPNELSQMIKKNEFPPMTFEAYFLMIEISKQKVTIEPFLAENNSNKIQFDITLNNREYTHNGYAIYNKKKKTVSGMYRILILSDSELANLSNITYTIGNESSQTIMVNNSENKLSVNSDRSEWVNKWRNKKNRKSEIIQSKMCKFAESKHIKLYLEKLKIYSSMRFPSEEECMVFANNESNSDECKERQFEYGPNDMPILFAKERNMQIYYNSHKNIVYGISNETVSESKTHFGASDETRNKHSLFFEGFKYFPFYFENITQPFFMCCRHNFMKNVCLRGQDNQFNIFRSLCFLSTRKTQKNQQLWARLSIGILVIILQGMLSAGVVIEVFKEFEWSEMFDDDAIIITISFLVFALISYVYWFTVVTFNKFYECMYYVCEVDWSIYVLDFISNIVIGFIIVVFSFFYLLLSPSIADVVINSFALAFIIELDDMANLFEADEPYLLLQDWKNCVIEPKSTEFCPYAVRHDAEYISDWDPTLLKRKINLNVSHVIWKVVGSVLVSPLFILLALGRLVQGCYYQIQMRGPAAKLNWTRNSRYKGS